MGQKEHFGQKSWKWEFSQKIRNVTNLSFMDAQLHPRNQIFAAERCRTAAEPEPTHARKDGSVFIGSFWSLTPGNQKEVSNHFRSKHERNCDFELFLAKTGQILVKKGPKSQIWEFSPGKKIRHFSKDQKNGSMAKLRNIFSSVWEIYA